MKRIIVQSVTVFAMSTLTTYEAVKDGGKEGLRQIGGSEVLTENLPPENELLIVLPIIPEAGDRIITLHEGEVVFGNIVRTSVEDKPTAFVVAIDTVHDWVVLTRKQFHVIDASGIGSESIVAGDELVSVVESLDFFPFGTRLRAESGSVGVNTFGQRWTLPSPALFRKVDQTVVDFSFTDEALTVVPAVVADEVSADAHDAELAAEQADRDLENAIEDELARDAVEGLGPEVAELSDEHYGFYVTDLDGNPIPYRMLPDDIKAVMSAFAAQIKSAGEFARANPEQPAEITPEMIEQAIADTEVPVDADQAQLLNSPLDFLLTLLAAGLALADDAAEEEAQTDAKITAFASESAMVQDEHVEFLQDGLGELRDRVEDASDKIAVMSNIVGRYVARAPTDEESKRMETIAALLSDLRNEVIEIGKLGQDLAVDVEMNLGVQQVITAEAATLVA